MADSNVTKIQPDSLGWLKGRVEVNELRARDAEARLRYIEAELKIIESSAKLATARAKKSAA